MKKRLFLLSILPLVLAGCKFGNNNSNTGGDPGGSTDVSVTGVSVSPSEVSLYVGETQQLTPTISPSNATNQSVTYVSDDTDCASVDDSGLITALAKGDATITVTTVDGRYTATCEVSVTAIAVTGVSLNKTSLEVEVDESLRLTATIAPSNATNQNVIWSSEDESVATVYEGAVTGVSEGNTTIKATTEDGGFTASCAVKVYKGEDSGKEDEYVPTDLDNIEQITEAGTYSFSGEVNKQIYVNAPDAEVVIELNGVTLSYDKNAPIYVATADSIDISAKKGTTNVINDNREMWTEDVAGQGKGAVYVADGDLKLKGAGSLTINGNYYNGIHGKDDVKIQKLTLNVNAVHHGIKGNDSLTISSGTVNIVCGGDGLKTDNSDISSKNKQRGNVTLEGGTVVVNSWGDAIDAAYNAVFEEADSATPVSFTAKTNKYSSYDGEVIDPDSSKLYLSLDSNAYSNGGYTYACYINETWYKATYVTTQGSGGGWFRPGPGGGGSGSRTRYIYQVERPASATSFALYRFQGSSVNSFSLTSFDAKSETKSFNQYYDMVSVTVSGSTINLGNWSNYSSSGGGGGPGGQSGNSNKADSSAKGIKAANEIQVISGTIDIKAFDDGLHTNMDGELENGEKALGNVTISGGNITVDCSDDGLHADNTLTISGGTISVTNSYEGLEGNVINVTGGDTTVFASDDGVNASGSLVTPQINVSGGRLDVTVSSSGDTDGIDSNGTYTQSGGVVIVRGPGSASGNGGGGSFALDAEKTITFNAGTIIIFGGMERTPTSKVTRTLCSSSTVSTGNHTVSFTNGTSYTCYLKYSTSGCLVYSELGTATLK